MKPKLISFSGAGFSVESGLPTFQGDSGLWNNHKISDVCSMSTFRSRYSMVHAFYDNLRHSLATAHPHQGHILLRSLSDFFETTHFTTNIDDLYEKAGIPVHHIHGKLTEMECVTCGERVYIGYRSLKEARDEDILTHKKGCTQPLYKPALTFYGEGYDSYPAHRLLMNALRTIDKDTIFVMIGSSCQVVPVDYYLRHQRCHKYNINPYYNVPYAHWNTLSMPASEGMQAFKDKVLSYLRA